MSFEEEQRTVRRQLDAEIKAKDAEIVRLKEENGHFAWRDKDKNSLITELCDALYDHMGFNTKRTFTQDEKLIERAREATK